MREAGSNYFSSVFCASVWDPPYHRIDEVFGKKMKQVVLDAASALSAGHHVSTCLDYHTGWELQ